MVLKCQTAAARYSSRKAVITAVMANSSGITVGTSARNRTIRMMNAATRPMMSLRPWVGGALSASPVNSTCRPAGAPMARSWFSRLTTPERGSSKPV